MSLTRAKEKGRITSLCPLATLFLMQSRRLLAFFATKAHCWLVVKSLSTRTPRSFCTKLLSIQSVPSACCCIVLFLPSCWTCHFFLLNFMILLSAHFCTLPRFLWRAMYPSHLPLTPLSFVLPKNLPSVCSVLPGHQWRSLIGPNINPCGTLLLTGFRAGLCTTDHNPVNLAVQPFSSSPQCPLKLTHTSSACLWGCYGTVSKVNTNKILCSPLIHQVSHPIVEGYQVGQIWLLPSDLLLLYTVWKLSPGLLPSLQLRWGCSVCSSLDLPLEDERPLLSRSPQVPPLITMIFKHNQVTSQWHWPAPSAFLCAFYQVQWTCVCLICLNGDSLILLHRGQAFLDPGSPTGLMYLQLLKTGLTNKDQAEERIGYLGLFHILFHQIRPRLHPQLIFN